jgi:hypothetical protein
MDPQVLAVPKVGQRLLTRWKTIRYLEDLHVLGKLACLGRLSRERDDLVLGDVWQVFFEVEAESMENDGISMFVQNFACRAKIVTFSFRTLKKIH